MKFRLAKASDSAVLADIHYECGLIQADSFMYKLGRRFLTVYYRLFLNEKQSVILIAEDARGVGMGFSSGTLDASEHLRSLRRHRVALAFAMLPALVVRPRLISQVLRRNRFVSVSEGSV